VITYKRMSGARNWDGASYDRVSGTMEKLALEVLERLQLRGDETVIDAGCGSGSVTESLIARLPRGRVIGIDESASMIEAARERLGERADLRRLDLLDLEPQEPVDAIFSTATFHWIADHERLFEVLHRALVPGGRLLAQCGGRGNITVLRSRAGEVLAREPYAPHFAGFAPPWNYATPEQTRARLRAAGFTAAECWLEEAPQEPPEPREFLQTIVLGPHVQRLPEALREPFMDDVLERLGEPVVVDYVRLNVDATA
jgi:trans-aconitate 2-methyltransferase